MKRQYTREEKIAYYRRKLDRIMQDPEGYIDFVTNIYMAKLAYLQSDNYQDWNSDLQKQLNNKTRKGG